MEGLTGKSVCVVDGKEVKKGYRIKEDFVIRTIRSIKKSLGIAKNNKLFVCEEHKELLIKKRKNYERIAIIISVSLAALFIFAVFLPLIEGRLTVFSFISFLLITVLMFGMLFLSHVPRIEEKLSKVGTTSTSKNKRSSLKSKSENKGNKSGRVIKHKKRKTKAKKKGK